MAGLNLKSKFNAFLNMSQLPNRVSASSLGWMSLSHVTFTFQMKGKEGGEKKREKNVLSWQKKKRGSLFFHKWGRRLLVAKEKKRSPTLALTGISKCSDCVAGLLDRDWYGTFCEWFILLFYLKHPLFLSHLTKSQITSLTNFILGKFNIPKMSLHSHPQLQNWTHPVFRTLVKGGSSRSSLRLPNISKPIPHVLKRQAFPGSLHAGCPRLSPCSP